MSIDIKKQPKLYTFEWTSKHKYTYNAAYHSTCRYPLTATCKKMRGIATCISISMDIVKKSVYIHINSQNCIQFSRAVPIRITWKSNQAMFKKANISDDLTHIVGLCTALRFMHCNVSWMRRTPKNTTSSISLQFFFSRVNIPISRKSTKNHGEEDNASFIQFHAYYHGKGPSMYNSCIYMNRSLAFIFTIKLFFFIVFSTENALSGLTRKNKKGYFLDCFASFQNTQKNENRILIESDKHSSRWKHEKCKYDAPASCI